MIFCKNDKHSFGMLQGTADMDVWRSYSRSGPWYESKLHNYYVECEKCHYIKPIPATPLLINKDGFEIGYGGNRPIFENKQ